MFLDNLAAMTKVTDPPDAEDESTTSTGDEHDEQSQFLLEKATQTLSQDDPQRHSRASKSFLIFCLASSLVFFTILAVVLSSLGLQIPHNGSQPNNAHVISNARNYVLDSDWNSHIPPTIREYDWTITDEVYNPDGVYRPMMLVNKQFPGPLIECNEGDTIIVHVHNAASNATSIHWHGLFQQGTPWMDGTVGISQCPIASSSSFTYNFTIQNQSGTYWWHAHHAVQTADGLFGPLIVHTPNERMELQRLEYASDRILMVQDYYHDPSSLLLMQYLASDSENAEPVPDSALINGQNIRDCSADALLLAHRRCDNTTSNVGRPVLDLEPNKRHRLRIINTGVFAEFQIQLDEHDFAVTEADGTAVEPAYFHRLTINPAQRYSIIVDANHTSSGSSSATSHPSLEAHSPPQFWLRARMITTCFAEENPALEPEIRGIVRYQTLTLSPSPSSSPSSPPLSLPTSLDFPEIVELQCRDLNTSLLHPVSLPLSPPVPVTADATIHLRVNFEIGAHRLSHGFFNASSWITDVQSPTLHRAVDNASYFPSSASLDAGSDRIGISSLLPEKDSLTLSTPQGGVIDLILSNFDDGAHPFHLHGHVFSILAEGESGYPPAEGSEAFQAISAGADWKTKNPLKRDTATLPAFGWIWLRFVADNVGMWAFHCHVSWHGEAGLMMEILVGETRMNGKVRGLLGNLEIPKENRELCRSPREMLEKGARPADEVFVPAEDPPPSNTSEDGSKVKERGRIRR